MKKNTEAFPCLRMTKLSEMKPHPDRIKTAMASDLHQLGKSYDAFGFLKPLVLNISTGHIIDGDQFLAALKIKLPPETMVPVWCVEISEKIEDLAHVALQSHCGEWNWERVAGVLTAAKEAGLDPKLSGLHDSDISPLTAADWNPAGKAPLDGSSSTQIGLL